MLKAIINKTLGSYNQRFLKKNYKLVNDINNLE